MSFACCNKKLRLLETRVQVTHIHIVCSKTELFPTQWGKKKDDLINLIWDETFYLMEFMIFWEKINSPGKKLKQTHDEF